MNPLSTGDDRFLATLEEWLRSQAEIMVQISFSRAAGNKSFEFFTSYAELFERLHKLTPETRITAFRSPQLPIRGVVTEEFIRDCLAQIHDGSEFLVVETVPRIAGRHSWYHHEAGTSHMELREALEEARGMQAAAGLYPPWLDDSPDIITAYVPDLAGNTKIGVY